MRQGSRSEPRKRDAYATKRDAYPTRPDAGTTRPDAGTNKTRKRDPYATESGKRDAYATELGKRDAYPTKRNAYATLPAAVLVLVALVAGPARAEQAKIRLIVRADDMGSSHTANVACIQCAREGIVKSVEVMVPGPWYPEAVKMLKENPSIDVGVHLTLTSEWEAVKWGPITKAPSLADKHGHFYPTTSQRRDFPPNTGFLEAKPKLDEIERELRAQIELAIADIPQVSHLSNHMGTATATPEMRAMVQRLSREYKLPLEAPAARGAGGLGATPEGKEPAMLQLLERLTPGDWILVEHPGQDSDEMRAMGHKGYENVAADRANVTRAFTSAAAKAIIARRGIQVMSYAEYQKTAKSL